MTKNAVLLILAFLLALESDTSRHSRHDSRYEETNKLLIGGADMSTISPKSPILLSDVDNSAHKICLEIFKKFLVLKGSEIEFYVEPDLGQLAITVVNKAGPSWVYFHPLALALEPQDFKALVAHELGHIACQCGDKNVDYQIRADRFAAEVVGKTSMRKFLLNYGLAPENPRIKALQ